MPACRDGAPPDTAMWKCIRTVFYTRLSLFIFALLPAFNKIIERS